MALITKLRMFDRIDQLIRLRSTGSPKELANKLGVSERKLYDLLNEMKKDFNCPLKYCYDSNSYVYTKQGKLELRSIFNEKNGK